MSTKGNKKSMKKDEELLDATEALEKLTGGPLTFAKALLSVRTSDGVTQAELATLAGVTKATICDLEKGRRIPSVELASKYAKILGYSESQFVRLALQDQIRKAGMEYKVRLEAA
jgi:transcriptional regulator with XRE-family HTH domain